LHGNFNRAEGTLTATYLVAFPEASLLSPRQRRFHQQLCCKVIVIVQPRVVLLIILKPSLHLFCVIYAYSCDVLGVSCIIAIFVRLKLKNTNETHFDFMHSGLAGALCLCTEYNDFK
jgi:hypothetical protein